MMSVRTLIPSILPFVFLLNVGCREISVVDASDRTRPLIIGHRGSSGVYPEHTILAYQQAIKEGADFIECDVMVTKDHQLVCLHDPFLSAVTDVAEHPEYSNRKRNMTIPEDGKKEDWFSFDFTLAELKTLRVNQRLSARDQSYNGLYQIPTLGEYIQVARDADRVVGIYPEMKLPEFINAQPFMNGTRFEDLFIAELTRHGYTDREDPCFVQSFSDLALRYAREKTDLRLVMLVWRAEHISGPYLNESKLSQWSELYYGVGAWKSQIVNYYDEVNGYKNWIVNETGLLREILDAGLKLHLYTFRNEDEYLAWDFKQDPINEYLYFDQLGDIEAYFTDFPATMYRAFQYPDDPCSSSQARTVRPFNLLTISGICLIITYCVGLLV